VSRLSAAGPGIARPRCRSGRRHPVGRVAAAAALPAPAEDAMGARHHGAAQHAPGPAAAAPPLRRAGDSIVLPRRRTAHRGRGDGSRPRMSCAHAADAAAPWTRGRAPAATSPPTLTSRSRPSPRLASDLVPGMSNPCPPAPDPGIPGPPVPPRGTSLRRPRLPESREDGSAPPPPSLPASRTSGGQPRRRRERGRKEGRG
jgi:hypothetical protein